MVVVPNTVAGEEAVATLRVGVIEAVIFESGITVVLGRVEVKPCEVGIVVMFFVFVISTVFWYLVGVVVMVKAVVCVGIGETLILPSWVV